MASEFMTCSICGGPLTLLGKLGANIWYRCVNCGMDQLRNDMELDES